MAKRERTKDKQRSTNHTHQTKDLVTRTKCAVRFYCSKYKKGKQNQINHNKKQKTKQNKTKKTPKRPQKPPKKTNKQKKRKREKKKISPCWCCFKLP